jgi:hypothetical protein
VNKLIEKARDITAVADSCGVDYETEYCESYGTNVLYLINIKYKTTEGSFYSSIQYSETKKASVETWEHMGGRRERVSLKALPDYLSYHAKRNLEFPEKVSA